MRIITLFLALLFVVSCAFLGGNSINPQGTEFFVYQAHSALGVSGLAYGTYLKIAPWMNQVVSILLVATFCFALPHQQETAQGACQGVWRENRPTPGARTAARAEETEQDEAVFPP